MNFKRWAAIWLIAFFTHELERWTKQRLLNFLSDHIAVILLVAACVALAVTQCSLEPEGTADESPTEASGYTRYAG